jgi:hypothetical protein
VSRDTQNRTFIVHEDLLCKHSPYFSAAFGGNFSESSTRTLDYDDTDPTVFSIFVQWLYTQQVEGHSAKLLTELWVLADALLAPALQNQIMRVLCDVYARKGELLDLGYAYEKTAADSPLRQLGIAIFSSTSRPTHLPRITVHPAKVNEGYNEFKAQVNALPKKALADLVVYQYRQRTGMACCSGCLDKMKVIDPKEYMVSELRGKQRAASGSGLRDSISAAKAARASTSGSVPGALAHRGRSM